ncbi:hypothetical protein [Shewanella frigidimarina]|uniref:hypothetical protein n=1 Tax=Shewanella frigidimarina TaxID=56812 RepID=UPI003D79FCD6
MDKSEHCKEVYAYYGLAMYRAQCVEQSIIQMLIFCDLYERMSKPQICREEWEAKFDSFDKEVSDKTMGRLIGHLKSLNVIQPSTEQLLASALKERNFLAHSYFPAKAMDFMSEPGRNEMISGLEKSIELFNQVENILNPLTMTIAAKYGLTEEVLVDIQNQALEEAKSDL